MNTYARRRESMAPSRPVTVLLSFDALLAFAALLAEST